MRLTRAQTDALAAANRAPHGGLVRDHRGWFPAGGLGRWRAAGATVRALASRELVEIGPDCRYAIITTAGRQALLDELRRRAAPLTTDH